MIRKLIKEIFGHYATPTDCFVYVPVIENEGYPMTIFVPEGSFVDVDRLNLAYKVRRATEEEEGDMQTFYLSRIRIDFRLASYTHIPSEVQSEHVQFGDFSSMK